MAKQIQLRRGNACDWVSANPILAIGEMGCEIDGNKIKIGNGSDDWNNLPYFINNSVFICQVYDASGITDCNSGVLFPFDGESFKDLNYTHSNTIEPERVVVNSGGIYKVHYNISHVNQTGSRKNIRVFCVINDLTMINPSLSYSYSRDSIDRYATNSASFFVLLNEGDYITVTCEQAGSSGSAISEAEGCWLMMEKMRSI